MVEPTWPQKMSSKSFSLVSVLRLGLPKSLHPFPHHPPFFYEAYSFLCSTMVIVGKLMEDLLLSVCAYMFIKYRQRVTTVKRWWTSGSKSMQQKTVHFQNSIKWILLATLLFIMQPSSIGSTFWSIWWMPEQVAIYIYIVYTCW